MTSSLLVRITVDFKYVLTKRRGGAMIYGYESTTSRSINRNPVFKVPVPVALRQYSSWLMQRASLLTYCIHWTGAIFTTIDFNKGPQPTNYTVILSIHHVVYQRIWINIKDVLLRYSFLSELLTTTILSIPPIYQLLSVQHIIHIINIIHIIHIIIMSSIGTRRL
jgi:hypothetical protein